MTSKLVICNGGGISQVHYVIPTVRPLLKKPGLDENVLKNYRPVSNLSFLSKCIERIVVAQLNEYLSSHDLFAKCQSAYRANHSPETALLRVHNDIMLALNDKKRCNSSHAGPVCCF